MEAVNTSPPTFDPSFLTNPVVFMIVVLLVSGLIYSFSSSSTPDYASPPGSSSGSFIMLLLSIIIGVILAFLVMQLLRNVFSINISLQPTNGLNNDGINNTNSNGLDPVTSKNIAMAPVPVARPTQPKKQVFNIPGNHYDYNSARALCKAYGADLATYNQMEEAYNRGAEWCNYGWSADQMALFPTQQTTYDGLQQIKGHKHDCGRPGINGGYIANPNVKFGANCYGVKPPITPEEKELMEIAPAYPITASDIAFQNKVDALRAQLDNILISPFNKTSWN